MEPVLEMLSDSIFTDNMEAGKYWMVEWVIKLKSDRKKEKIQKIEQTINKICGDTSSIILKYICGCDAFKVHIDKTLLCFHNRKH